ncbi:MAG: hypothetical protein J5701_04490 [Bacteroidales bacterium]|nr:hypothetical protein [Bacteroidales bacterium]
MNKLENSKEVIGLFALIVRWKKLLIAVALSAAVLSLAVSLLITPKFKSTVIMLPTSSNAVSQMIMVDGNYNEFLDATQFGDDIKIDQMLQILNSRKVKDHLVQTFDLIRHYDLDTNKKYWKTKLYKNMESDITFSRTNFMGVQITVVDKNPQMAAAIANEVADYYDTLKREIIQQRTAVAYAIVEREMDSLNTLVSVLSDSLSRIMQHGVYDYETQSERLYQQYVKEIAAGNTAAANRLQQQLVVLEQWGPQYVSVRDHIMNLREMQQGMQSKLQEMRVDAQYAMTQKFVVEKAVPADKKYYPKKSVIVVVSTLCALILAFFFILCQSSLQSAYEEIKQQNSQAGL